MLVALVSVVDAPNNHIQISVCLSVCLSLTHSYCVERLRYHQNVFTVSYRPSGFRRKRRLSEIQTFQLKYTTIRDCRLL